MCCTRLRDATRIENCAPSAAAGTRNSRAGVGVRWKAVANSMWRWWAHAVHEPCVGGRW